MRKKADIKDKKLLAPRVKMLSWLNKRKLLAILDALDNHEDEI